MIAVPLGKMFVHGCAKILIRVGACMCWAEACICTPAATLQADNNCQRGRKAMMHRPSIHRVLLLRLSIMPQLLHRRVSPSASVLASVTYWLTLEISPLCEHN